MFLPVEIDRGGYIRACNPGRTVIHRETRKIPERHTVSPSLDEAKVRLVPDCYHAVLELTEEGGGKQIWVQPSQEEEMLNRLKIWRGCYGLWPVVPMASTE